MRGGQEQSANAEQAPELVSGYHRSRFQVVVTAGLILLWRFGVPFEGPLPLLGVRVTDLGTVPYLLGCVLVYGVVRLLIEWAQSVPARRRRLVSRADLTISLAIAGAGAWALADRLLPPIKVPPLSFFISAAPLVMVGIATGELASLCLFNLFFIRSREEARRLALPRFPVAVRATFRWAYVILPTLLVVLLLAPSLSSPLSYLWPWLVGVPAFVLFLSGAASLLPPVHAERDGTKEPRSDYLKRWRKIFDMHDSHYQVGGWDKPIPPHNTALYEAAERGETNTVRHLLDKGADPDEPNMHGWRAMMIAVAQQHEETAILLLERGADPNITNFLGRTALMFAARYGNVDLVRRLIQQGARVDLNESPDPNALSRAAIEGHLEVVRLLLDGGANPTVRDRAGLTAQEYAQAAGHGEIAALLRRAKLEREREPES